MLAWLRGMALMEMEEKMIGPMLQTIGEADSIEAVRQKISNGNLRKIVADIPLEVAKRS